MKKLVVSKELFCIPREVNFTLAVFRIVTFQISRAIDNMDEIILR